jgi:hypothetical protein
MFEFRIQKLVAKNETPKTSTHTTYIVCIEIVSDACILKGIPSLLP